MTLPLWFLVFALFVPRIVLFIGWHHGWHFEVPQPFAGLAWFFFPRALVLMSVYASQGFSPWFWAHFGACACCYARYAYNYRTNARKAVNES